MLIFWLPKSSQQKRSMLSVTRFDKNLPLCVKFKKSFAKLGVSFYIWQNLEPTLVNVLLLAKLSLFKWPNIALIIHPSDRAYCSLLHLSTKGVYNASVRVNKRYLRDGHWRAIEQVPLLILQLGNVQTTNLAKASSFIGRECSVT